MIYSSQEDNDDNLAILMSEADRYLKQGKLLLPRG
jgi:hypothetical protein